MIGNDASRARQHMAIVSSIRHTDITNDYNDGACALNDFPHYAESLSRGDAPLARQVLDGLPPSNAGRWDRRDAAGFQRINCARPSVRVAGKRRPRSAKAASAAMSPSAPQDPRDTNHDS